jgi:hypothetical protein
VQTHIKISHIHSQIRAPAPQVLSDVPLLPATNRCIQGNWMRDRLLAKQKSDCHTIVTRSIDRSCYKLMQKTVQSRSAMREQVSVTEFEKSLKNDVAFIVFLETGEKTELLPIVTAKLLQKSIKTVICCNARAAAE